MTRLIVTLGILVSASAGCRPIVLEPLETGATTTTDPPVKNAVAIGYKDWATLPHLPEAPYHPPYPDVYAPTYAGSLALFFSERPQPCAQPLIQPVIDPNTFDSDYGPYTQLMLILPPELARPGLIDLRDNRINSLDVELVGDPIIGEFATESNRGNPWAQDLGDATLEIGEAQGGVLPLSLHWMPGPNFDSSADYSGEYEAAYCGDPPPAAPPTPGLILSGADLPAQEGEPPPDPERLYLFLGNAGHTCEDPTSPMACTQSYRVMLSLPPELQVPGILDLTDPAIEASFVRSGAGPSDCQAPQNEKELMVGTFEGGTVEILSIDASAISLRLYGSHTFSEIFGKIARIDADGDYLASMCP